MLAPRVEVERTGLALALGVIFSVLFHAALFSPQLTDWMRGGDKAVDLAHDEVNNPAKDEDKQLYFAY